MLTLKTLALAAGLLVTATTATSAADKKTKKADKATAALFKKLDSNGDGKVTKDEFGKLREARQAAKGDAAKKKKVAKAKAAAKRADATAALFTKLDANTDGSLTAAEFGKLAEAQKAARAAPKKKKKAAK